MIMPLDADLRRTWSELRVLFEFKARVGRSAVVVIMMSKLNEQID